MKYTLQSGSMHHRHIVIFLTALMVIIGVYGLIHIRKNEFPRTPIRVGTVKLVCPGLDAKEVEERATKLFEDYIFEYQEIDKNFTSSNSFDGYALITVWMREELKDPKVFWNKFKQDVLAAKDHLPDEIEEIEVDDNFGEVSSVLIALESKSHTYHDLNVYMNALCDSIRKVKSVGRMEVSGMQYEQISIYIDSERLQHYGISDRELTQRLKDFNCISNGRLKNGNLQQPIYVANADNNIYALENAVVHSEGNTKVRLKDIAKVVREFPELQNYVTYNGNKCLILSVEMAPGYDVSAMGKQVKEQIAAVAKLLPSEIKISTITDQSQIVDDSIINFLKEMLIAIISVILVVVILMPLKVALVAALTIPVTVFSSLAIFWLIDLELNVVSLAAMIVVLGMIVDDAIVIIDGYVDMLDKGMSSWHASITSARHFLKSIFSATLAISITFFPLILLTPPEEAEFLGVFPWAVTIILFVSILVAQTFLPIVQHAVIRKTKAPTEKEKKGFSILGFVIQSFDRLVDFCFRHKKATVVVGGLSVLLGLYLMGMLPSEEWPKARRNQFAVEITNDAGASMKSTAAIADSIEKKMRADERVVSITSFKGIPSPRFCDQYAPVDQGPHFAQFIVNTTGADATDEIVKDFQKEYSLAYPDVSVSIRQISFGLVGDPVEIRVVGSNLDSVNVAAMKIRAYMNTVPELLLVKSNISEPQPAKKIVTDNEQMARLGLTNADIRDMLTLRYGDGIQVGTKWHGYFDVPVIVKWVHSDSSTVHDLLNEQINIPYDNSTVPLKQIASVVPVWQYRNIPHRSGLRTAYVTAQIYYGNNINAVTESLMPGIDSIQLPKNVKIQYGGQYENDTDHGAETNFSLVIAVIIMFFIILWHFKSLKITFLMMGCLLLTFFGTAVSTMLVGVPFSLTSALGMISLMGILVRDGIILFDYAAEVQREERLSPQEAIQIATKRRMRPILLTTFCASMGVVPMVIGKDPLWVPLGSVVCFGAIITLFFIRTVMPVLYALVVKK